MTQKDNRQSTSLPLRKEAEYFLPDLSTLSQAEISRGTGISPSMISRMFSDLPEQKRPNPTLNTLLALQSFLEKRTGTRISLDMLVDAIR
jgi:transcriptional regulator with XRE-family HTH domain